MRRCVGGAGYGRMLGGNGTECGCSGCGCVTVCELAWLVGCLPLRVVYGKSTGGKPAHHDTPMATLKFLWNGIKANGGKIQRASYLIGGLIGHAEGTITIYAKSYRGFSAEVHEAFTVLNDSDSMTDYFETDRIRVTPDHSLYAQVLKAAQAWQAHADKMSAKREERWAAQRAAIAA